MSNKNNVAKELLSGFITLLHGFIFFKKHPKVMILGAIPAAIVSLLLSIALITLIFNINSLSEFLTSFANNWYPVLQTSLKVTIGVAIVGGTIFLSVISFTALTLIFGDSFYTRIWKEVELADNGTIPKHEPTFIEGTKDGLSLLGKGMLIGLISLLLNLIPFVGSFAAAAVSFTFSGYLLADELTGRAMNARSITSKSRTKLVNKSFFRAVGFGAAVQLCFMIPFGAIFAMPAAVVGSTRLAKHIGKL